MTTIKKDFGAGGVGLQPGHGDPDLAETLRAVADDLGELAGGLSAWSAELNVATHVLQLTVPGVPIAVEATVAGSVGVKAISYSAAAAGQVRAEFTAGVPKLTFAAADAVTKARVLLAPRPASVRTIKG
jgi:hypothetical protein